MALHRLTTVTLAVPDPDAVAAFYTDFGLERTATGLASADGGEQLRLVDGRKRRGVRVGVGCDDPDDLDRVATSLAALGVEAERAEGRVAATDPGTGVQVVVEVAPRLPEPPSPSHERPVNHRAPSVERDGPVRPRKLSHVVLGSTDLEATKRFFTEGVGFAVSDEIVNGAAFLRCSADHHNLLVQPAPIQFTHHLAWLVDDIDEVGRGAKRMLEDDPSRHIWGLGRHHIGSNFFWYLRDPSGTFAEYTSDVDRINDADLWKPGTFADLRALYSWGPPVPPSFLAPDDLAELMAP